MRLKHSRFDIFSSYDTLALQFYSYFEFCSLKDTYNRIKNNQYTIPPRIGKNAAALINRLLAPEPSRRPKIKDILNFPFFTDGFLPKMLPSSCLTMPPKFNMQAVSGGQTCLNVSGTHAKLNDAIFDMKKLNFNRKPEVQASPRPKPPVFTGRAPLESVPETKETPPAVAEKQDIASVIITEMPAGMIINSTHH